MPYALNVASLADLEAIGLAEFLRNFHTFLFLLPVAIFTFLLRNHLLRGMSFGAIRK